MSCTSYFNCNNEATRNLSLEEVFRLLIDVNSSGCPILRTSGSSSGGSYVPYTGATTNVNLGSNNLSVQGLVNFGNAVATNQRELRVGQGTAFWDMGSYTALGSSAALYANGTPGTSNYILLTDGTTNTYLNAPTTNLSLRTANVERFSIWGLATGGVPLFRFTPVSVTAQTASTEYNTYLLNGATSQWATGNITTQRGFYIKSDVYSAVGASVFASVYGAYIEAPTASTNVTFTNNYALGLSGNMLVSNGAITSRITPRVTTIVSSATPTINTDNCDAVTITALAAAITSFTTNLTGTPNNFDQLTIRIKDDGTARALAFGASFVAGGVALPTTTVISTVITIGFIYDSVAAKWRCEAVS